MASSISVYTPEVQNILFQLERPRIWGNPWWYLIAALLCVVLENIPTFDQLIQKVFFQDGSWILSKAVHNTHKMALYTGPKIFIGIVGSLALMLFVFVTLSPKGKKEMIDWQKPALLVFLSICLIPLVVSALKAMSGVYSPVDMLPYGGQYPHIGLLEQLWLHGQPAGGRSFPAGHASGGFALMALYYLPLSQKKRRMLLLAGITAGWVMGVYQMARGEHFMSHTLTTMFIALTVITLLARKLRITI